MQILILIFALVLSFTAQAIEVPSSREEIKMSFSPVVKRTAPAVVNIFTRRVVQAQQQFSPLFNDPFFRHFFGEQFGLGMPQEKIQRSLGSGVIVANNGLIVTNHHVIKNSDEITVVLSDRREFEAKLVGSDPHTDLAILKIDVEREQLPYLELGDSDALEVGDLVLAIGNPFGVGQTVTSGIVSALARNTVGISDFQSFIQTDAAINPGNSGGALVNLNGALMGINTAIYSQSGGSVGIGFAIPAAMVRSVVAGIVTTGKPIRPWLGAAGQSVTAEIAASLGLPRPVGVLVTDIYPGGAAEQAGLRKSDIIVAINNRELEGAESLRFRTATLPVGQKATLHIVREGKGVQIQIPLIAAPDKPPAEMTEIEGRNLLAGASIANINPAIIEELGLNLMENGVLIVKIRRGSTAQKVKLRPGDVLVKLNNAQIRNVEDAKRTLDTPNQRNQISVKRDGKVINFEVGN